MGIRTHFLRVLIFTAIQFHSNSTLAIQTIPKVIVKRPDIYSSSGAPKTIITHQQINITGATSLSQALQELGGVQLEDTTGSGSQVLLSMRGFGVNANSNTLLMINGIPLSNPDLSPPDLNAIPLQEIEYIEIINGSEGVLYGDQAVGGIINIITSEDTKKKIEVSCSAGSYSTHKCYASLNNHRADLHYNFSFLGNHTNNYRDNNNYDQTLLSGNIDYPYFNNSSHFDYKIINERMGYPGALTAAQVRQNRRQAQTPGDVDFFRDWNGLFHFRQKNNLSSHWNSQIDLSRREMHGDGVLFTPFDQSRYIYFIKPQIKGVYAKFTNTSGIEFDNDKYNLRSVYGLNDDSLNKYGIYTIADYAVNSQLSFSAGARGAQQNSYLISGGENLNRATATTIGATYLINPQIKIYLRRAGSFRFPNDDENAFTPAGVNSLKTQRGVAYESGIQWNLEKSISKFNVYQLNLVDEIAFDPTQTPQQPFGANRNLDPTERTGFSLIEKYEITNKLAFDGQYNYVNARYQNGIYSGNRIPAVSENILHAGLNYGFAEHWNIYSEAIYTGNQYSANDDANVAGKVGGFTYYNTNLRFHYQEFSASFRINNIFNKYYNLYTVYTPSINLQTFYPAPARNIMLTMKYLFL